MSRHSDLAVGCNELGISIAHTLKVKFTNKPESIKKMEGEEVEYRSRALSKLFDYTWNDSEKKEIEEKTIKRVKEILDRQDYADIRIKITNVILEKEAKQQLTQFFRAIK